MTAVDWALEESVSVTYGHGLASFSGSYAPGGMTRRVGGDRATLAYLFLFSHRVSKHLSANVLS